ncbi:MAG: glycosyltransferase family 39 protein [Chloroflexota bacterium]
MLALTLLALHDLGALSLWRDEVASVIFSKGSLPELLTIVGRDRDAVGLANMATYYLLLHFWLFIGETEARIRLLSVIFGVASVVPVYFIARRLAGWLAGGLAAGIFVLIPYVIHYSQEARGYSLAMLVAGSLTWLLLIGVERRTVWPWAAYGLIAALGLYVHFFVALIVAAHGLWVLATRSLPPWRSALAALLPILLAAAPIPFIIAQFGGGHGWIGGLTVQRVVGSLTALTGSPFVLLAIGFLATIAVIARRTDPLAWLLLAAALTPIAMAIGISVVKPMLVARYLVVSLPALAALTAVGLVSLRPSLARYAALAGLAVALMVVVPGAYSDGRQMDWRAAARWIGRDGLTSDRMIAPRGHEWIAYYLERFGTSNHGRLTTVRRARSQQPARLWVILMGGPQQHPPVASKLAPDYVVAATRAFGTRLRLVLLLHDDTFPARD